MLVKTPRRVARPPVCFSLLALLAAACGGGDGGTDVPPPTPTITVAAAPATLALTAGQSGTSTITLTRGGNFTGAVSLAVAGAPAGVTATLNPTSLTGTTLTSTLTVATAANAAAGPATLTITASGTSVAPATATVALTVTAPTPTTQTLTVTNAGTGTGTVTSSPAGINCGTTCTAPFTTGASVTLTATAATGSTFAGWSGACSGTTATCTVTMSAAQTATATFNTAAPAASFTLALAPAAVSVQAGGAAGSSALTLVRTNFTGAVALTTSGAPAGLTVTPNPASVTGTTATLDVTAAATVAPGTYNVTVTGAGTGVTSQTATLAVTVTAAAPAGSFTLAVAPATVPVVQGGTGTATVTVTRANGFTGAVNLAVSGAPAGLTVTPNPASATGGTSTLNVAAAATTAPGTYTITVTGTGTGVAQQTATFAVQVTTPPAGGGNVTFSFAGCDATQVPIWLAVQNANGTWTRVTPGANNAFSFTVGATGGVAYVTQSGTTFNTTVFYMAGAEFGTGTSNRCGSATTGATGGKTLNGTVANVGQTEIANVSIGGATKSVIPLQGAAFTLTNVPDGPRDLVATRAGLNATGLSLNKAIIRRNTNYANNSTIPVLDFAAAEAFDPVQRTLTVGNLGTDQGAAIVSFVTANGGSAGFFSGAGTGGTLPYFAVPAAQLQATDLQQVIVSATPVGSAAQSFRYVFSYFRTPTDRTVTLGPSLANAAVTSLGTTPYLRLRAQVPAQGSYNGLASATFSQTNRTVSVFATALFSGTAPATWNLDIPDLSGAGYDPTWGLRTGASTSWTIAAFGGDFQVFTGATPTDNAQVIGAGVTGSSTAFIRAARTLRRP